MRALVIYALLVLPLLAKPYEPAPGSKERTEILNAVRDPLEDHVFQELIFHVSHLRVEGGWAFLMAQPRTKADQAVDYKGTLFETEAEEADEMLVALLRFKRGRWYVVTHALFTTDVWWADLAEKYHAPPAIFPSIQSPSGE